MENLGQVIVGNLMLVILLASGIVWIKIFTRLSRPEPLVPFESRRPVPWTGWDVVGLVLFGLWCELLAARVGHLFLPEDAAPGLSLETMAAAALGRLAWVFAAVAYLVVKAHATPADLGWNSARLAGDLKLGLIAFLAAVVPVFGVQLFFVQWLEVPSHHPLIELVGEQSGAIVLLVATLVAAVVAPLFEEFLFRVVLQGWIESRQMQTQPEEADESGTILPARPGVAPLLLVSFVFAALHLGSGPDPIPIFILSLFLGYVYRQTHRILPSLVVHFCVNGLTMLQLWTSYYWPPEL